MPPIIIDSREQAPFPFDGLLTTRAALRTGDYSLLGFDRAVTVERKSHQDAWGCAGRERKRFERCLHRMSALDRALVVIEPSLSEFLDPPLDNSGREIFTRLSPASAAGAYLHWMATFGVPVVWAGNRLLAERITFRFLQSWWRHRGSKWIEEGMARSQLVIQKDRTRCIAGAAGLGGSMIPDRLLDPVSVQSILSVADTISVSSTASAQASNSKGE